MPSKSYERIERRRIRAGPRLLLRIKEICHHRMRHAGESRRAGARVEEFKSFVRQVSAAFFNYDKFA